MHRLALDIGGTFTDGALLDVASGALRRAKVFTEPDDLPGSVQECVEALLAEADVEPDAIEAVIHGTTLVANTLIERRGATTALVSTAGFRDVLELGADTRYDIYDLDIAFPEPLVPRARRLEVQERVTADGAVALAPTPERLAALVDELRASGAESVAVALLHAYGNAANERVVSAALAAAAPELDVCCSADVAPEIREYERTSTVVANAYVRPIVRRYLDDLEAQLASLGIDAPLYVMLSNGAITSASTAARVPVRLAESGPAGGVLAACLHGVRAGDAQIVAFDVGGTTAKICFADGEPAFTDALEVARVRRHLAGSGLPLKVPSVELLEIGAGGGSIATVGATGLLQVGPRSAGAAPGPACYGRGGREATVTDADLVLGHLADDLLLAGRVALDPAAAHAALARLGERLGRDAIATAVALRTVVDNDMASAVRLHAAERSRDPRAATLVATGGAGPVHAYDVARILRLRRIVYPPGAGTGSTLGFLIAPLATDVARSDRASLARLDRARLATLQHELEAEARHTLDLAAEDPLERAWSVDLRYEGQGFELPVAVDGSPADGDAELLTARFEEAWRVRYGANPLERPLETVTWRLRATAPGNAVADIVGALPAPSPSPPARVRTARFAETGWNEVPVQVLARESLAPGAEVAGPLIVEERDSTAVIGPAGRVRVDAHGSLVVELAWR